MSASSESETTSAAGNGHLHSVGDLVDGLRDQLGELPATASIAYLVLRQAEEPMSSTEIADISFRSRSSIHRAAGRLQEVGLVERRLSADQGRSKYVWQPVAVGDVETTPGQRDQNLRCER